MSLGAGTIGRRELIMDIIAKGNFGSVNQHHRELQI